MYYVPTKRPDPYPPKFDVYLNIIAPQIGGEVKWVISSDIVRSNFAETGKSIVSRSFIGFLNSTR